MTTTNPTPRKRGRPPVPQSERTVIVGVSFLPADRELFMSLGGSQWLRDVLRRIREQGK